MKIGYARVSTADQNLDLQIRALEKEGCEKIYYEKASGARRDRPELIDALNYARSGDSIVVWKLDRLARSLNQLVSTVEDLNARGIQLVSLGESINTNTASGKLFFHMSASFAEFERSIIRERVLAGVRAAQAKGIVCGRPKKIDESTVKAAKAMLLYDELTVKEIAQRLGMSEPSLYRYIKGGRSAVKDGVA